MDKARLIGRCVQGLVMGLLLYLALSRLVVATGEQLFRYQGF